MLTLGASRPSTSLDPEANIASPDEKDRSKFKVLTITKVDKDFGLIPIPRRLRYDPDTPFHFGLLMNISFGFGGTFRTWYAAGLLFIAPLGDLVRRRQLILGLTLLATTLTIGLAVTNNLIAFEVLSFLIGMVSVVPQILLPLAADLAPPNRRASAISIVLSGFLLGILVARVLAGVIADVTTWRVVYYTAIGTQALVLSGGYLILPDYPAKNDQLTYWEILRTMAKYAVTEPLLIQVCLINLLGLFGLVGMAGVALVPVFGRWMDKLFPWHGILVNLLFLLCFQAIQTGAGGINVAAVVVAILGTDLFRQTTQVRETDLRDAKGLTTPSISDEARSRLNSIMLLSFFIGQVMGTSVGTKVFIENGWRAGAGLNMGWYGLQLLILLVRGPHCPRYAWFGYEGGLEGRRSVIEQAAKEKDTKKNPTDLGVKVSSLNEEGKTTGDRVSIE
ncbi:hypothetical protein C0989_005013 [Termitomyces sp. Mn162]|nr:hypothetical protein C0989_005013 [Termitomyces sp. Mn162]